MIGGGGAGGASYGDNDTGEGGGGAHKHYGQVIPLGAGTHSITVGNGGAGRGPDRFCNGSWSRCSMADKPLFCLRHLVGL